MSDYRRRAWRSGPHSNVVSLLRDACRWIALVVTVVLCSASGCAAPEPAPEVESTSISPDVLGNARPSRGKTSDRFPNINLRTQFGDDVRFFDDLIRDRVVLVNFMYTTCTGI
jgi:cytochrome oxidase Cu insertion factor (SCO1/SenC/PrrC family)